TPIPVKNDTVSPNGQGGRILLATPNLSANPLQNTFYQGWVYAAVVKTDGSLAGLYMTKDFGTNWTQIALPGFRPTGRTNLYPTNNTSQANYDPTSHGGEKAGAFDVSLAIDPTNPNIVYLGGVDSNIDQPAGGLLRIDTTKLLDVYALVGFLNNSPT